MLHVRLERGDGRWRNSNSLTQKTTMDVGLEFRVSQLTVRRVTVPLQALHDPRVRVETRFAQLVQILDHVEVVLKQLHKRSTSISHHFVSLRHYVTHAVDLRL